MTITDNEIFDRIKKVCAEVLKVDQQKIFPDSRFRDDLGADSLDIISLLMMLEDEFKRKITDEEAATLVSVKDLVAFLKNKLAESL